MTKRITFFIGIWVGVILGGWVTTTGLNQQWQWQAYDHHAAHWEFRLDNYRMQPVFTWNDQLHSTPTPGPRL